MNSNNLAPIDISKIPGLIRIVEEVKTSNKPRILKQGDSPVAMIMPVKSSIEKHKSIESFEFKPLSEVEDMFIKDGYSKAEVEDMIEAMSELPQYARTNIQKGK